MCLISYCALIFSCNNFDEKHIVGPYHLAYTDISEQTTIYYEVEGFGSVGVIPETVYSVGYNNSFIVAKQHPYSDENGMNRTITNYFIIPIASQTTFTPEAGVIGPLGETEFKEKIMELNKEPIEFSISINKLK